MAEMMNLILFICRWKGGPVGASIAARPTDSGMTRPTWLNRIAALYFAPILLCFEVLNHCWWQTLNRWWQNEHYTVASCSCESNAQIGAHSYATRQTPTIQIQDPLVKSALVQQYIVLLWRFNTFLKQSKLQLCAPATSSKFPVRTWIPSF